MKKFNRIMWILFGIFTAELFYAIWNHNDRNVGLFAIAIIASLIFALISED